MGFFIASFLIPAILTIFFLNGLARLVNKEDLLEINRAILEIKQSDWLLAKLIWAILIFP